MKHSGHYIIAGLTGGLSLVWLKGRLVLILLENIFLLCLFLTLSLFPTTTLSFFPIHTSHHHFLFHHQSNKSPQLSSPNISLSLLRDTSACSTATKAVGTTQVLRTFRNGLCEPLATYFRHAARGSCQKTRLGILAQAGVSSGCSINASYDALHHGGR